MTSTDMSAWLTHADSPVHHQVDSPRTTCLHSIKYPSSSTTPRITVMYCTADCARMLWCRHDPVLAAAEVALHLESVVKATGDCQTQHLQGTSMHSSQPPALVLLSASPHLAHLTFCSGTYVHARPACEHCNYKPWCALAATSCRLV